MSTEEFVEIEIDIDEETLAQLDKEAAEKGITRDQFVNELLQKYIDKLENIQNDDGA